MEAWKPTKIDKNKTRKAGNREKKSKPEINEKMLGVEKICLEEAKP